MKVSKSIVERYKRSNPKGRRSPKLIRVKAGGKHLLVDKRPSQRRRMRGRDKVLDSVERKRMRKIISMVK